MRQITFACQPSFEKYSRPSRREQFLSTMEEVVPWSELEALIEPYYPKAGKGRRPVAAVLNEKGTQVAISLEVVLWFVEAWR
ncbi:MAG: hypothetical protein ACP5M4_16205, partial [Acidobacteriaceae bacterium]